MTKVIYLESPYDTIKQLRAALVEKERELVELREKVRRYLAVYGKPLYAVTEAEMRAALRAAVENHK